MAKKKLEIFKLPLLLYKVNLYKNLPQKYTAFICTYVYIEFYMFNDIPYCMFHILYVERLFKYLKAIIYLQIYSRKVNHTRMW